MRRAPGRKIQTGELNEGGERGAIVGGNEDKLFFVAVSVGFDDKRRRP